MDYDNNTRVTFDYKLKLCIMNMPTEMKRNLESMDYLTLQEAQKEIRDYFLTHQNEFNIAGRLTESNHSCPDYYALLSAVTSDLSICESWDDVYKQFVSSFYHEETLNGGNSNFSLCNYGDDYDHTKEITCMCRHLCSPENMSIVSNDYTGFNALIACDCLEKTGIISSYQFKKKIKQSDCYAKILVKKEIEKQKQKNYINKWEKLVSMCLEKNETSRKCIECGILSIFKTEPHWKKKCLNCYIKPVGVCLLRIPIK